MGILTTLLHYTPYAQISLLQGHRGAKKDGIRNFPLKLLKGILQVAVGYIVYMIHKGIASYDKYPGMF